MDYYHDYFTLDLPLDIPQGGVPEPASFVLLLVGGVFAVGIRRSANR